ncbi:MAG: hypothetical protein WD872_05440 [Pirellulaceae bacterium]
MSQPANEDIWEARLPQQLMTAVTLVAVVATLDAIALGQAVSAPSRSPQTAGALAIALACGQVAVAAIFFTLGNVGLGRQGLILAAAIAYGGGLVAAGSKEPIRWDAGCGELFVLAGLLAVPGAILRLFGTRLVHRTVPVGPVGKPWQFSLSGSLALLTAAACFFAAVRALAASKTSGVGVVLLEWALLAWLPWMCFAVVMLPLPPLVSLGGLWLLIGLATALSLQFATWLNRPAMALTVAAECVCCALLLFALRWAGYRLAIASPPAGAG